ncbi:MAG: hypothetical protein IPG75_20770 [Gemmatimonadetes bacterium]|nr:hypothetical protein [Gemmatimonadota bacterium]
MLLTHGLPHGILDQTSDRRRSGRAAPTCAGGSRGRRGPAPRLRPHPRGAYGIERHGDVTFVNAFDL